MHAPPETPSTRPPRPMPPPAGPVAWSTDPGIDAWLTSRRNRGVTPAEIASELVANGWSADVAARRSLQSLRSSDRQPVLWFALCWSAGLAAVGFTTAAHQLLLEYPDRMLAAAALTLSVVMAPIAFACGVLAATVRTRARRSRSGRPSAGSGSAPSPCAPRWSGSSG